MKSLLDKFTHAIVGLFAAFKDVSVQIQIALGILAIVAAFFMDFNLFEWSVLLLCCGLVILSEMINSCFEDILDFIHPEYSESVKSIKDKGAGFVLFASLCAFIIGILLFGSKLL